MRRRAGFSLVEMMVGLTLLGLVAAFSVPALNGYISSPTKFDKIDGKTSIEVHGKASRPSAALRSGVPDPLLLPARARG